MLTIYVCMLICMLILRCHKVFARLYHRLAKQRFDRCRQSKVGFFDFYYLHNFPSILDYYKAISIDLPTVYSSEEFDELDMAVKLDDMDSTFTDKYFVGCMCNAYSLKMTNLISLKPHIILAKY